MARATNRQIDILTKNPYVGPRPFERGEEQLFYGRDWEAEELVALIVAHPVVLFYAQSGAGKSSLLNARVLPALEEEEGCELLPVARVRGDLPPNIQAAQIENIYTFNTILGWSDQTELGPSELVDCSLAQFLDRLPHQSDPEGYPALRILIFDQFEELFTFYPERWPEREQFFVQVGAALQADSLLRVLFVIREDYLAQLDPYVELLPGQLRTRFRLERLRKEAALAAVTGPLSRTPRSFAPGIAENLVDELLKIRVEDRRGQMIEVPGEFVEPVQLQVVCQSLWSELPPDVTEITRRHLHTFGNVDQALTRFYERTVTQTAHQTPCRESRLRSWFDRAIITPTGTRGLVYRGAKSTGGIPNAAVDLLEDMHLIRGEQRAGARWYELTHDRFIAPIQTSNAAWRTVRLKRWGIIGSSIFGMITLLVFVLYVGLLSSGQSAAIQATQIAETAIAAEANLSTATAVAQAAGATATAVFISTRSAGATTQADSQATLEAALQAATATAQAIRDAQLIGGFLATAQAATAEVATVMAATATTVAVQANTTPDSTPLTLTATSTPRVATVTPVAVAPTATPAPERPAISGKLAFPVDNGSESYDVLIVSLPDGQSIASIRGARQPNFRADGVRLLVNGESAAFGENVFEATSTGVITRSVSGSPTDSYPVYSPDGSRVAYSNPQLAIGADGKYHSYIFVQCGLIPPNQESDPNCQDIARFGILKTPGDISEIQGTKPVWTSSDQIVYSGCNTWAGGDSCGIFTVGSWANKRSSNGDTPTKIIDRVSAFPTDSKGSLIAFQSRETGDWEAFVTSLNGATVVNLSNNPGSSDGLPTISPDGQWVAFASDRDGSWTVYVAPITGGQVSRLFDFPKANPWGSGDRDWTNERMSWGP